MRKGKRSEREGRKASGLSPLLKDKIAGLLFSKSNLLLIGSGFFYENFLD